MNGGRAETNNALSGEAVVDRLNDVVINSAQCSIVKAEIFAAGGTLDDPLEIAVLRFVGGPMIHGERPPAMTFRTGFKAPRAAKPI